MKKIYLLSLLIVLCAPLTALSDVQLADLAAYMRLRFAPGKAPWPGLEEAAARVRATPSSH